MKVSPLSTSRPARVALMAGALALLSSTAGCFPHGGGGGGGTTVPTSSTVASLDLAVLSNQPVVLTLVPLGQYSGQALVRLTNHTGAPVTLPVNPGFFAPLMWTASAAPVGGTCVTAATPLANGSSCDFYIDIDAPATLAPGATGVVSVAVTAGSFTTELASISAVLGVSTP